MATIYYITEKKSETGMKMNALVEKGKEIKASILNYLKEIKAKDYATRGRCVFGTGIVAVHFDETPDMKDWKKFKHFANYYQPRISSKIGKGIQDEFESFGFIERDDVNEVIGLKTFLKHCGYGISDGEYFGFQIDSEWKHTMPEDCKEITYTEYNNNFK